mmetsp:Transcript_9384/g.22532  ORF Transcript_9384/g.22532 Transcript_9384/m.22532 type:complete len:219 (-) Transcript_9384:44-700(-)
MACELSFSSSRQDKIRSLDLSATCRSSSTAVWTDWWRCRSSACMSTHRPKAVCNVPSSFSKPVPVACITAMPGGSSSSLSAVAMEPIANSISKPNVLLKFSKMPAMHRSKRCRTPAQVSACCLPKSEAEAMPVSTASNRSCNIPRFRSIAASFSSYLLMNSLWLFARPSYTSAHFLMPFMLAAVAWKDLNTMGGMFSQLSLSSAILAMFKVAMAQDKC